MKLKTLLIILIMIMMPVIQSVAQEMLSRGQSIYLPVYSTIYYGDRHNEFNLTVTVSIRNTNSNNPIKIEYVNYYSTSGKFLKKIINSPIVLKSLESHQILIKESDTSSGVAGNFIIKWSADKKVNPPVVESIMIGTKQQQGISFLSKGIVINEDL